MTTDQRLARQIVQDEIATHGGAEGLFRDPDDEVPSVPTTRAWLYVLLGAAPVLLLLCWALVSCHLWCGPGVGEP